MSRHSFASPLRPKLQTAKKFLSLQMSQASHALSDEFNNILKGTKPSEKKRRRIVDEIFSSEQSYQEHVHLITSMFLSPLRELSVLPEHVLNVIFSNIEAIQSVNRELLVHMETMGIGDAFLALAPFLKLYSTYANNFENALNTIKEWERKSPKFASFKKQQENLDDAKGLKLNALLITPIQRIPRYKMLLENLLWKTPEDHDDFSKLKEAVDQISKMALDINENIRQHENFQKILSIQNSFSRESAPKLLAPGRVFIKEGTLLKVGKRGWRSAREKNFFLFSDILIYAKRTNDKDCNRPFTCLKVFPLHECKVHEVLGDGNTREGGALFSIEFKSKSLLLFSKSQGEAKSWLNEIRKTIENVTGHSKLKSIDKRPLQAACNRKQLSRRKIKRSSGRRTVEKKQAPFTVSSPSPEKELTSPLKKEDLMQDESILFKENKEIPNLAQSSFYSSVEISGENGLEDDINSKQLFRRRELITEDQRSRTDIKRKLSESELSFSSNKKIRKSARLSQWFFPCTGSV
ncbi:FYVE, RhoGEF and PH domain-containing protein 4-like [Xenia sp. Carnegie-2017]|uniref:FYVE, RhoGEF and PH domain-containing protein 4-like n=1 Tax=Xenia sp. Carnegie-2017 TaxID=2897299 RepID=UPI001F03BE14|nr:FYVE, RhoGEF and PH domain-containing protein 4-like [Xenia sp. Carnegie-2017]